MFDRDAMATDPGSGLGSLSGERGLEQLVDLSLNFPPEDLEHALNANQIACKSWLVDQLFASLGGRFGTVYLLGGWYAVTAALLLGDGRFRIARVRSFDVDPNCAAVAEAINRRYVAHGRFEAITADVRELDYEGPNGAAAGTNGHGAHGPAPNLVINTSCEHMLPTAAWYRRVPRGMLLLCQSNDYFSCAQHVNCMTDLAAFKADLPMAELYYEGALERKKYTRFMLIGRK